MISRYLPIFLVVVFGAFLSYKTHKLTLIAAVTGAMVAMAIFSGEGYTGVSMLAAFFILGTAATSWKKKEKLLIKSKQTESLQRNAGQVLANAGVAAALGIIAFIFKSSAPLFSVMLAASMAAATADTLSSELGTVYGRRFFNILTLKRDEKGLDGVVSMEGTLLGVAGAGLIALINTAGVGWHAGNFIIIVFAGTAGNLADSVLGASLERKGYINNDMVNFLNTLTGALIACLCLVAL